jgi:hypothetical protein
MWRGSRHIILVERGRRAPPASIIYGISSGGWRGDVTAQTLVALVCQLTGPHTRSSSLLTECSLARISTGLAALPPELPVRVALTTLSGHAEAGRRMANQLRRRLHMPALRRSCCLTQRGWPAILWQQHPLHNHRRSTTRTAHHPRATVIGG